MLDLLNAAIDVLEEAVARRDVPDIRVVARAAGVSEHHFRRMFSTLAGMPLSVYVRRRRLTLAAYDVVSRELTLLDVAVRHGYGSVEAFNRAFLAVHGVAAGQARRRGTPLISQPRISFQLTVQGSSSMRYRIVEKPAFSVVGRKTRVPLIHLGPNEAIIEFERGLDPAVKSAVAALSDQEPRGTVAVTDAIDETRDEGSWLDYWHAAVSSSPAPAGLESLDVPAGTWVVFAAAGPFPETMQHLWRDAYGEWFPSNPWQTRPGPEILTTTFLDGDSAEAELWLPIEARG